jgi:hypothetical protein
MNGSTDDELSPAERDALARLDRRIDPPASLEERTVAALRREALVRDRRSKTGAAWLRPARAAIAAVLVLGAGFMAGRWWSGPPAGEESPADFILILRAGPEASLPDDEAELMRRVEEYTVWARLAGQSGSLVAGEKLQDGGRLLERSGDGLEAVALARVAERGSVQGYFLIRSASYEEAVRVARDCPHLRYGGAIELRKIERFQEERS